MARIALSRRQAYDNIKVGSEITSQERVIFGSTAPVKDQVTFAHGENLIAVGRASLIENMLVGVDPTTERLGPGGGGGGGGFNFLTGFTIYPPPTTGPYAYSPPYGTFMPYAQALAFKNRVQGGDSNSASTIVAPAASHGIGDLIVMMCMCQTAANISTVTDTIGNTYAAAGAEFTGSNNINIYWAKSIGTNASNIVTVNLLAASTYRAVVVYAITGQKLLTPVNTTKSGSGSGTALATSAFTLVAAREIICAIMVQSPTITAGTGYTLVNFGLTQDPVAYFADEYKIVTAGEAATATASPGGAWQIFAAAFKNADAPVGFPAVGGSYVDPVFGTTIRRLTANDPTAVDGNGFSDIYIKNGWWNADGSYFVTQIDGSLMKAIHSTTGVAKALTNPGGAAKVDLSCSPVDADIVYYFSGTELRQQLISTGVVTTVKDFGSTLGALGGTSDWIDNTGRYMLLKVGSAFRVWDKQTDTLYTGSITDPIDSGWIGMVPDATYLVLANGTSKKRYAINHVAQTLASSGTTFFTGGGDHGDLICPTDGHRYMIRVDNDFNPALLTKIDIETGTVTTVLTYPTDAYWTSAPNHISCVSQGTMRNWVIVSSDLEGGPTQHDDDFTASDPVATWNKMQNEIYMVNVLTSEIRRLAHTRTREAVNYLYQPRCCASWDGTHVAWGSNFGVQSDPLGYADIYCIAIPT